MVSQLFLADKPVNSASLSDSFIVSFSKLLKVWSCHGKLKTTFLDCEQSLFFFRFSESNARARERRSRETRETRAAARE